MVDASAYMRIIRNANHRSTIINNGARIKIFKHGVAPRKTPNKKLYRVVVFELMVGLLRQLLWLLQVPELPLGQLEFSLQELLQEFELLQLVHVLFDF